MPEAGRLWCVCASGSRPMRSSLTLAPLGGSNSRTPPRQHGRNDHEDFVESPRLRTLSGDLDTEDVDVPAPAAVRPLSKPLTNRWVSANRGPLHVPAEGLALPGRAPVRVVAAKGTVADQEGANPVPSPSTERLGVLSGASPRGGPGSHRAARSHGGRPPGPWR